MLAQDKEASYIQPRSSSDTEAPEHGTFPDQEKQDTEPPDSEVDFLVQWDGDDDPLNPRSFSTARKWLIVLVVSLGSLLVWVFFARSLWPPTC